MRLLCQQPNMRKQLQGGKGGWMWMCLKLSSCGKFKELVPDNSLWPFWDGSLNPIQRLSDLPEGIERVTLNHLVFNLCFRLAFFGCFVNPFHTFYRVGEYPSIAPCLLFFVMFSLNFPSKTLEEKVPSNSQESFKPKNLRYSKFEVSTSKLFFFDV